MMISSNVFNMTRNRDLSSSELLKIAFHRGTTVLYLLLALWGAIGAVIGVHSLQAVLGPELQHMYAVAVTLVALVAATGSMYFPKLSVVELFAGSGLIALMALYPVCVTWNVFILGNENFATLAVFSTTALVIPAVRVTFVYNWLVTIAKRESEKDE